MPLWALLCLCLCLCVCPRSTIAANPLRVLYDEYWANLTQPIPGVKLIGVQLRNKEAVMQQLPRVDIVVPFGEEEALALSQWSPVPWKFAVASSSVVEAFSSKSSWAKWMTEHGLGHQMPQSYSVHDDFAFPVFAKSSRGTFGTGVFLMKSRAQLEKEVYEWEANGWSYVIQEAVLSYEEWVIYVTAYQGKVLHKQCFFEQFEINNPVKGALNSPSSRVEADCPEDAYIAFANIISSTGYTGLACTQLKFKNKAGRGTQGPFKFLEINPRGCGNLREMPSLFLRQVLPLAQALAENGRRKSVKSGGK